MVLTENPLLSTEQVEQLGDKTTLGAIVQATETARKDVSSYKVTVTGGTLDEVAGDLSYLGNAVENEVVIDGGINDSLIAIAYGGIAHSGNADGNTLNVNSGTVYYAVGGNAVPTQV
jgi:hypothetical protein